MKRLAFLLALSLFGLTACGGGPRPTAQPAPPPADTMQLAGEGTGIVTLAPPAPAQPSSPIVEQDLTDGATAQPPQRQATASTTAVAHEAPKTAELKGTYWRLATLSGVAITRYPNQPEPHLILQADGRTAGSDGCNRFFGAYSLSGDGLSFSQGGTSLMACPEGVAQAAGYMGALRMTRAYRLQGNTLEVMAGGKTLATFEAASPR